MIGTRRPPGYGISGTTNWSTKPDDMGLNWASGSNAHEVLIPPGKCVFHWLGCESVRYRRNYCRRHYHEAKAIGDLAKPEDLPRAAQDLCTRCRSRQSTKASDMCGKCVAHAGNQRWHEANRESVRKRRSEWRAKNRDKTKAWDANRRDRRRKQETVA